jgi:hypothetical protein
MPQDALLGIAAQQELCHGIALPWALPSASHQQVLVQLLVADVVRKVGCTVERCKALLVPLVHLCPIIEQVVHLHRGMQEARSLAIEQYGKGTDAGWWLIESQNAC